MTLARTWTELLARHPVIRRARKLRFVELEQQNLIRHLERAGAFQPAELAAWREPGPRSMAQLMGLSAHVAGLLDRIALIESGFPPVRREEMLAGAFAFLEDVAGLPQASIRGLFAEIRWTTPRLGEVVAGGGLSAPVRRTSPGEVQTPDRRRLLVLVARRITHDLLIHGNSLRCFYQALPLMRETIDRGHPGLTDLYIGFAASLQLLMTLYGGAYPDGAAIRAGRVEVAIQGGAFKIRVSGINFPSLFNEIVKGLYEALLHPGMPTADELGADEPLFRELTSGPDLEYELQKVAPEASLRIHGGLVVCHAHDPQEVRCRLQRAGHEDLPPQGEVSMLYRAFARITPARAAVFACRALERLSKDKMATRFAQHLIDHLED